MILVGNQRSGGKNLAQHLLKQENEHIEVYDLRGFASDDLISAFQEIYAISRATKCKKYLYSLSLNTLAEESATLEDFESAIDRIEEKLGLTGQPGQLCSIQRKPELIAMLYGAGLTKTA